MSSSPAHRPTVAVGPVAPGWGSWEWVGQAFVDACRDEYTTITFDAWDVPDADAVVVIKHAPPAGWAAEVAGRSAIVYCPIDHFDDAAGIAAAGDWLGRCAAVVVHARRLAGYFAPFAVTVYLDHPLKFTVPTRQAFKQDGPVLWVGVRTNLPPLVDWVNAHPLPAPLEVLTNPERPGEVPSPEAFGFRPDRDVRIHEWTPAKHLSCLVTARVTIDVKGSDFRSRHKPPAKALDFVASGIPVALTPGGAAEHLAGLGLVAPSPLDAERWLSEAYWEQTRLLGEALSRSLSAEAVAVNVRRVIGASLRRWSDRRTDAVPAPTHDRGPAAVRLIGLMITKDDHPVFADWCRDQLDLYDAVVCLDGSDGDETARVARGFADKLVYLRERDYEIPHKTDHGLRRVVHLEIVRRFGRGHWVMCCHPDEFCYHDPRKVAGRADRDGHDQVGWYSPHFYPHPDDLADWDDRRARPLPDRLRHYHWSYRGDGFPWVEDRLYRDGPGVEWDDHTHGSVRPHGLTRPAPYHPILRHFKVQVTDPGWYDTGAAAAHYRTHWVGLVNRTGVPFPVRRPEDLFVREVRNYTRCDRFDGTFTHDWNLGEEFRPDGAAGRAGRDRGPGPVSPASAPSPDPRDGDAETGGDPDGRAAGAESAPPGLTVRPVRVAILSLLFNWPSTGGGNVHTAELARFLAAAGYDVRHLYARYEPWGVGRVAEPTPHPADAVEFGPSEWTADGVVDGFRRAVDRADPDWVVLTDSWNMKPLLARAAGGRPYVLRLQALECLCPLNNLRLLPGPGGRPAQCPKHQLATPDACARCVREVGRTAGDLHRAERALAGVGTPGYRDALVRAFADAAAVFVVNPPSATMVEPHARAVRVVTAGMDPARFPRPAAGPRPPGPLRILFAGLTREWAKGFHVLREACGRLWRGRQDFVLVATDDPPPGGAEPFAAYVGWRSQADLPGEYYAADVVAVPAAGQEALGRTAVEAMAAGRPVVAARIGGLPYTVTDGVTGLLFEPGDAGDLARKLATALDDPALRDRLGAAARRRFEADYSWPVVIERHYRPLFGGPASSLLAGFDTRGPVDEAVVRDVWERDVYCVRGVPASPAVVLDVGGHIGAFAALAARLWPGARVVTCEPDPDNITVLRRNLAGLRAVEVVEAAVVESEEATVTFHAVPDKALGNSGGGSCGRPEPGSVPVPVRAVSAAALWRRLGLARCDLLKLDCEGGEAGVLRSLAAEGLLARVGQVVGEWHAADASEAARAAATGELAAALARTHVVEFGAGAGGREGPFLARPRPPLCPHAPAVEGAAHGDR